VVGCGALVGGAAVGEGAPAHAVAKAASRAITPNAQTILIKLLLWYISPPP
jgi:hypothetical protein